MYEQSKAAKRRFNLGQFHLKYFVGHGIDIGGGPDPLSQYAPHFALMYRCDQWDLENGDAMFMGHIPDNLYDFAHSSHCLEHMVYPSVAFDNWLRIIKPGGYLIVTIPDEDMYERGVWPSAGNPDHKWHFTIRKLKSWDPYHSINILDLLAAFEDEIEIIKVEKIEDFYYPDGVTFDQTLTPNGECCIELILRKR